MESYFFVPGNRLHKLKDIQKLKIDEIIIDLEDAVKISEREQIMLKLISSYHFQNKYIRVPLYTPSGQIDLKLLNYFIQSGFKKFIFPKIQSACHFELIINEIYAEDLEIIILIETPRFFFEAKEILLKNSKIIKGIAIGSHDFMAAIGGVHNLKNLEYIRLQILYLARMIGIKAIDIASMEIGSASELKNEIIDGFEKGFDAKFYIHPWQIEVKNKLILYSEIELQWAMKVKQALSLVANSGEFNPVVIDKQIIERPHLHKAEKIIKYYETK